VSLAFNGTAVVRFQSLAPSVFRTSQRGPASPRSRERPAESADQSEPVELGTHGSSREAVVVRPGSTAG
jgi:hypothetical protein